ncbi:hypothetical protein [Pseudonocardia xinjiangensis]|uniref:hypothetical protein n=1 Tax=Pseudonocardia xinjiangensis TaxID=75289 RepID=UPI0031D979EF
MTLPVPWRSTNSWNSRAAAEWGISTQATATRTRLPRRSRTSNEARDSPAHGWRRKNARTWP